jgi:DNA-binding response OmpR family regulator
LTIFRLRSGKEVGDWASRPKTTMTINAIGETILVVDDAHDLIQLLEEALRPDGYQIIRADNGRDGVELALAARPDLIMLDMQMPLMNGLEVLKELRRHNDKTPVIFMTTFSSAERAVEAFRLGVHHYLSKPFDLGKVRETVAEALRETRLKREQEMLQRNLIAAEAVRQTVVTLAHHINSQLMVMQTSLSLQGEMLAQEKDLRQRAALMDTIANGQRSALRITAVLTVLQKITSVETTEYHQSVQMLDIAAALEQELGVESR